MFVPGSPSNAARSATMPGASVPTSLPIPNASAVSHVAICKASQLPKSSSSTTAHEFAAERS